MEYTSGHFQVGTLTVSASGTETVSPLLADNVFENPGITVVPLGTGPNYRFVASVYLDGALLETHNCNTAGELNTLHMQYPNKVFPPNIGNDTKPAFFSQNGFSPNLGSLVLVLENSEAEQRDFTIYSTFRAWLATAAKKLTF